MNQWIGTLNDEVLVNYLAKSTAWRIYTKLSFIEGKSIIWNFMKPLIAEIMKNKDRMESIWSQINTLIMYTLGILKHPMFWKEINERILNITISQN